MVTGSCGIGLLRDDREREPEHHTLSIHLRAMEAQMNFFSCSEPTVCSALSFGMSRWRFLNERRFWWAVALLIAMKR